jgi:hypothetical protein
MCLVAVRAGRASLASLKILNSAVSDGKIHFEPFVEPESLFPPSHRPATGHYPEQINPAGNLLFYFFKIHFNIILLLCLDLPSGLFDSGFHTKVMYQPLSHGCHMPCTSHPLQYLSSVNN